MKKVKSILFFIAIFIFIILASCKNKTEKYKHYSNSVTKYSEFLKIIEKDSGVYITIIHPERKNQEYKYYISDSKRTKTPKGFIKLNKKSMNFLVLSTTHIGMLAYLNKLDKIKGTCSGKYIYNKEILQKIASNQIQEFENESNLPIEKIISLKPKTIIYSGVSSKFTKNNELVRLGIQPIPNFDWKESHPIGRAEWLLFFGYLTGTENLAKKHLENITINYNNLKKQAKQFKKSPTIIMGSKIGNFWFGPAGKSYAAAIIKAANANYIYKETEGTGSLQYSMEKVFVDSKESEFWLNPGFSSYQLLEMTNSQAKLFSAFQEKKVYCYTHNPNKYWELSSIHPDWVLSDLIQILHPEIALKNPYYFYKALE
jgi:iron complex transport system substrate-binding protein